MLVLGDGIAVVLSVLALVYGIYVIVTKKPPLYFQLIVAAVACYILGYLFDICEWLVSGVLSGGYMIGYFGFVGCFLFLLTASYGHMDGIIDDRTSRMKGARWLALVAPVLLAVLFVPNLFANISGTRKIVYAVSWVVGCLSSYFNLKHAIIPDMGFGFVQAIRPFNMAALSFTFSVLLHLTFWGYGAWIPLTISGTMIGASCLAMVITAERGLKHWII